MRPSDKRRRLRSQPWWACAASGSCRSRPWTRGSWCRRDRRGNRRGRSTTWRLCWCPRNRRSAARLPGRRRTSRGSAPCRPGSVWPGCPGKGRRVKYSVAPLASYAPCDAWLSGISSMRLSGVDGRELRVGKRANTPRGVEDLAVGRPAVDDRRRLRRFAAWAARRPRASCRPPWALVIRRERDGLAVGRECGAGLFAGMAGEAPGRAALDTDGPQVTLRGEDQRIAVEGRILVVAAILLSECREGEDAEEKRCPSHSHQLSTLAAGARLESGNRMAIWMSLWRTHSCVPSRHSCRDKPPSGRWRPGVGKSADAAR